MRTKYTVWAMILSGLVACQKRPVAESNELASVDLSNNTSLPGDFLRTKVTSLEDNKLVTFMLKKNETVNKSFEPGEYRIEIDLIVGTEIRYSSNFCSEVEQSSEVHNLVSGSNHVTINLCDGKGDKALEVETDGESNLEIDVKIIEEEQSRQGQKLEMYVEQSSQAVTAYQNSINQGNAQVTEALKFIAEQPSFIWLSNDWIPAEVGMRKRVSEYRDLAQGKVLGLILYDVPGRDCGQYSSGGVGEIGQYLQTVRDIVEGLAGSPAMLILEPDALPLSIKPGCEESLKTAISAIRQAVDILAEASNVKTYIDAGHSRWLTVDQMYPLLKESNIDKADGFALNTSNYVSNNENLAYGQMLSERLGGKKFVIDTSRNGRGVYEAQEEDTWCNPPGRALGGAPMLFDADSGLEAYIWAKKPGESDGTCRGGAPAGVFMPEMAIELYNNAKNDGTL